MTQHRETQLGRVYLVGAGPGDPGLLTLRGAQCLRQADIVLYDYLVNPATLVHAPSGADVTGLGHHSADRTVPQAEINALMIRGARQGKVVVRLKGGAPEVFGRGAEEVEALRKAGVPYEIVPGITAGLAAAGYAEIPVTHGQHSSAVALVTGQERTGKAGPPLDYRALASFPGTLIFYMGVTTARHWSEALIGGGKSPSTPVAIVRRCTWSDQCVLRCQLKDVADVISQHRLRPPAVILVGDVVSLAPELGWFDCRPLLGTRVLLTRPMDQAAALCERLTQLGADVLVQPAIRISDPPDWGPVDRALSQLDRYDWLVFSSSNGVRYLLHRLLAGGKDLRQLGRLKLAAIGPGTAEELARFHLQADLIPAVYRAEALAEALAEQAPGRRFLLARASRGREVLARQLSAAGGSVEQIVVYSSDDVVEPDPDVAAALSAGRIDWITVTSSSIARALAVMFGDELRRARLLSISPVTSEALRQSGHDPAAEAIVYTMEGLVQAILEHADVERGKR
jgi:uroporphyrinogen III methyltransferase/synthase